MVLDPFQFEKEIRHIAALLWPDRSGGGALVEEQRERDGVFETEEAIHILEVTTSTKKQKATEDARKISQLIKTFRGRFPEKAVKGWFITLDDPTGDQRTAVRSVDPEIVAIGSNRFKAKLIDAISYLQAREDYPFGSISDPSGARVGNIEPFVQMTYVDRNSSQFYSFKDLLASLIGGKRLLFCGSFGSGKSMTMREMFRKVAIDFRRGNIRQFPIHLNLRDHAGQTDPSEAIHRHARKVGFKDPAQLIRAWRAGFCILFLDGFDEFSLSGWIGQGRRLQKLRYASMQLVRNFVEESPADVAIALAGRDNYFDSDGEMNKCLRLSRSWMSLSLQGFSEEQIREYLVKKECDYVSLPHWFPSKPFLLGTLVSLGVVQGISDLGAFTEAEGWMRLLEKIAQREAAMCPEFEDETVLSIICRIASMARANSSGLGPLEPAQLELAFHEVCGHPPDDNGTVLLQRLAVLARHDETETRMLISEEVAAAAAAGDVARFIQFPFSNKLSMAYDWISSLPELGIEVVALKVKGLPQGQLRPALKKATGISDTDERCYGALAADILRVMIKTRAEVTESIQVSEAHIDQLVIAKCGPNLTSVRLRDCIIQDLSIEQGVTDDQVPRFVACLISTLSGRNSSQDFSPGVIDAGTKIDSFESAHATTDAILEGSLPLPTCVLLTVLKKLYMQRGSGRRENALRRGLDHKAIRYIDEVLELIRKEGFAVRTTAVDAEPVWLPVRDKRTEALDMLSAPHSNTSSILKRCSALAE